MKYIWEESDIKGGVRAALDTQVIIVVFDPFPRDSDRNWRIFYQNSYDLSCDYSATELAHYLSAAGFAPYQP